MYKRQLQGPSENATTIDNLSAYGIHVTNMKVTTEDTWNIAADAKKGTAQNCIDFKVGPENASQDAYAAAQGTGIDLSKNAFFDICLLYTSSREISTACSTRPLASCDPLPTPPRGRPGNA